MLFRRIKDVRERIYLLLPVRGVLLPGWGGFWMVGSSEVRGAWTLDFFFSNNPR